MPELQSKEEVREPYTAVRALAEEMKDETVVVRGRAQTIRAVGKKMAFLVVMEKGFTVQCVVTEKEGLVSRQMVKFVVSSNRESIVDVHGSLTVPRSPIKGATQQVKIQLRKIYCVNKALPTLPINLEDAARSEADIEKALQCC
ncbi:aspartate--tRNA ligase 2, cytoplasmic-like [Eucalyptus grandis]|uniref:aspartate--tRNA ligase 2, cytoplasmic-like n=1 Tax=Eucalyptus grandis TaxID=71139 RepID=UPI00192ED109|nr:aspartate--tRNA ligase 2, cytoplasmic-like [Eucalyptus grandis]